LALLRPSLKLAFHLTPDSFKLGEGGPVFPGRKTVKTSVNHVGTSFLDLLNQFASFMAGKIKPIIDMSI
jgi:hypothetical protein